MSLSIFKKSYSISNENYINVKAITTNKYDRIKNPFDQLISTLFVLS